MLQRTATNSREPRGSTVSVTSSSSFVNRAYAHVDMLELQYIERDVEVIPPFRSRYEAAPTVAGKYFCISMWLDDRST